MLTAPRCTARAPRDRWLSVLSHHAALRDAVPSARPACGARPGVRTTSSLFGLELRHRLLGQLALEGLLPLPRRVLGLRAHDVAAPLVGLLSVVRVVLLARGDERRERLAVVLRDGGEADRGGRLLVYELAEAALALHNRVRHLHLAAERGQPGDELDRVDVVRDDDKLRLLLLDQLGEVVDAVLERHRLLGGSRLVGGRLLGRRALDALLLLGAGLGHVLLRELEELGRGLLLERRLELVDRRRHLEALVQDLALPLQAHVLGPRDEPAHIGLNPHIAADAEVLRLLLPDRASQLRGGRLGRLVRRGGRSGLLCLGGLRHGCECSARC
mmetsp:Transcript_41766/g.103038  ORF Transcript_41766/g.103038 Transcript_41766/m.103038 type:complete len:329 (+) Transcript_41766:194-1180(+)